MLVLRDRRNYETVATSFVQISNNSKPFPVYVLKTEEIEDYYDCFEYVERTWNMYLMFLHQNCSFALFSKVCLKIGIH